ERHINPWIVTVSVMLATFMEVLDTTVVNVSIPHISGNLSATVDEGTWVVTSYLVSNAIILPMSGWLASYFGRRRVLILCVAGFSLTSLLCGLATSLDELIFFRILQGVTGGGMVPLAQSVMLESFPPEKHGQAMAAYSIGILLAPIVGPTLGGWITDSYTWRWIFFINVPVGVLSVILMGAFVWDPPYLKRPKGTIDYPGIFLLALGFGCLQIVLDTGQKYDWFGAISIRVYATLCVIGLVGMVIRELTADHPIVDLRALKNQTFAAGVFLMTVIGFVLYGSLLLLPIYLQTLLDYPALQSGLALSPRGIGALICTPIVGILTSKRDPRKILAFGLAIGGFTMWELSRLNLNAGYWDIFWPQVLQGVGLSCTFIPLATASMSLIPKPKMSNATAIFNLMRNIGGSFGVALMTTFVARRTQFHQTRLVENISTDDFHSMLMLEQMKAWFMSRGADAFTASRQALGAMYGMVQRHASMMSFVEAFWIMAVIFWVVTPLVILLRNPRRHIGTAEKSHRTPERKAEHRQAEVPELVHA
ncbi:MAG TPA: DHA2 family efflux MFS transporter permease subunit, partial [Terriglobales bacterium]|nr:DHA2 family efflux MFS transporter permease subunit [Terriglobales bacterium]